MVATGPYNHSTTLSAAVAYLVEWWANGTVDEWNMALGPVSSSTALEASPMSVRLAFLRTGRSCMTLLMYSGDPGTYGEMSSHEPMEELRLDLAQLADVRLRGPGRGLPLVAAALQAGQVRDLRGQVPGVKRAANGGEHQAHPCIRPPHYARSAAPHVFHEPQDGRQEEAEEAV